MNVEILQCADALSEIMSCKQGDEDSGGGMMNEWREATHKEFLSVEDGMAAVTDGGDSGGGMTATWVECLLGDVVNLKRGYDLPHRVRSAGAFPVVSSSGVTDYHSEAKVKGPGVVTGRYGTLGQVFYIESDYWPLNTSLYVQDFKGNDPRFISYFLGTLNFESQNAAGAVPGINRNHLHAMDVRIPSLPVQRRIAGILSAYDELIENSQRRIRILEEMARALYREWFVHFRFPGHENHPHVPSSLGDIPQGWDVKKLKDVCLLTMGQSPKSEFYNDTGEGQPFHQGVTNFGERFPTDRLFCTVNGRIAEAGDILFSVRAPVGRMNIADKKIIIGRGLSAIRNMAGHQAFLWEQLRNRFTKDDMIGNGAIFAAVTKDDMQGIELVCPPAPLVFAATKHFEPIHSELGALTKQIQNLRCTRDLLLPRLLSGQIVMNNE